MSRTTDMSTLNRHLKNPCSGSKHSDLLNVVPEQSTIQDASWIQSHGSEMHPVYLNYTLFGRTTINIKHVIKYDKHAGSGNKAEIPNQVTI